MKIATIEDLQTRLPQVLSWLRSGEDVVVKGEAPAATRVAESEQKVDWSRSAVFQRPKEEPIAMTAEQLQEFYSEMRGFY